MGEGAPVTSPAQSRKAPPSPAAHPGDTPGKPAYPRPQPRQTLPSTHSAFPGHAPGPRTLSGAQSPRCTPHTCTLPLGHTTEPDTLYKDDDTNKTTGTHHTQRAGHQDAQHTHIHTPDASQTHITQRRIHHRPTCTSHTRHPATHAQTHTTHRASPQRPSDISLRGPFTTDTHVRTNSLSYTHAHTHTVYLHRDPQTFTMDTQAHAPYYPGPPTPRGAKACPPTVDMGVGRGRQDFPPAHLDLVLGPVDKSSVSSEAPWGCCPISRGR